LGPGSSHHQSKHRTSSDLQQLGRDRIKRGSGRGDIIYENERPAGKVGAGPWLEDAGYVTPPPIRVGKLRLGRFVLASHNRVNERDARKVGHSLRKQQRLIEPALTDACRVERNRTESIGLSHLGIFAQQVGER
jgi:hypothetical protein